jgi:uncharacterized membrane protein YfcA
MGSIWGGLLGIFAWGLLVAVCSKAEDRPIAWPWLFALPVAGLASAFAGAWLCSRKTRNYFRSGIGRG